MPLPTINRHWTLIRRDTSELFKGQFEAEEVSEDISVSWTEKFTLNRQKGITQFLHGDTDTVSFRGRFFNETVTGGAFPRFGGRQDKRWNKLKEFARRDPGLGAPPVLIFYIGDGHLQKQVVIDSISGIRYDQPAFNGELKGVTFTLNLREFTDFDIEQDANFDTRYHHALSGDYYELLAKREYNVPDLGVWLRQNHPTQPNLQVGQIVRLPAPGGPSVRTARVHQTSVVFKTAYGRSPTPQRDRRLEMIRLRGGAQVSHIITGNL
jgi:hypothetical protein